MAEEVTVALERLGQEPYTSVLCYPTSNKAEARRRLKELERLGVTTLRFSGKKRISHLHVLGKGCVGVVVLAVSSNKQVALKIRRVDADRAAMRREATLLGKANSQNVGPELLDVSSNVLVMGFSDGVLLPEWLKKTGEKTRIRNVLRDVLEQCWRLDSVGLDHGELSHAPRHIIVSETDKPVIVDFETASLKRRPSNVTSLCQFLFIGSHTAKENARRLGEVSKDALVEALRQYKKSRSLEDFRDILRACNL